MQPAFFPCRVDRHARALLAALLALPLGSFAQVTIANLGTAGLDIDEASSTAIYTQNTNGITFGPSVSLGDTLGGLFLPPLAAPVPEGTLGLIMRITGPNPNLPFSLEIVDEEFKILSAYQGDTSLAGTSATFVPLTLVPGTASLLGMVGLNFSWDGDGAVNVVISSLAVQPSPTPTPQPSPSPSPSPSPAPQPSPSPSPSASPAPNPVPSPSPAASPSPTPTVSPTPSPSPSPEASPSPTPQASPGPAPLDLSALRLQVLGHVPRDGGVAQVSLRINRGLLTGQLRAGGKTARFAGPLSGDGEASFDLPAWVGADLAVAVSWVGPAEGGAAESYVEARLGDDSSAPLWPLAVAGGSAETFALAGWKFTALAADESEVHGFATLSVSPKGVIRWAGRFEDGRLVTGTTRVVRRLPEGILAVPLRLRLPAGAGEASGVLDLAGQPEDGLHVAGQLERDGLVSSIFGMRWEPPARRRTNLLDRTAGEADFSISIGASSFGPLVWPPSNRVSTPEIGLTMSARAGSGSFAGRVNAEEAKGKFRGVLFQEPLEFGGDVWGGAGLLQQAGGEPPAAVIIR